MNPSSFMRWLERGGRKFYFNYAALEPHRRASTLFFYTCNVSVKRSLMEKSGWFDESFPFASHEDLELGDRLAKKGMRLIYDPDVIGYHWHYLSAGGIARRVYLMGYSAHLYWQKTGRNDTWVKNSIRSLFTAVCSNPTLFGFWTVLRKKHYSRDKSYPLHWRLLLFLGFFIGLSDAERGKGVFCQPMPAAKRASVPGPCRSSAAKSQ
jgi:GT2 family glycosyltransferase